MGTPRKIEPLNQIVLDEILDGIVLGTALTTMLKEREIKWRTWAGWLRDHPDAEIAYWEAKKAYVEATAEQILAISSAPCREKLDGSWDGVDIQQRKLLIDSIKWAAGKLSPARYGDSQKVELSGSLDIGLTERLTKAIKRVEIE